MSVTDIFTAIWRRKEEKTMLKDLLDSELTEMEVDFTTTEEQLATELGDGAGIICGGNCTH